MNWYLIGSAFIALLLAGCILLWQKLAAKTFYRNTNIALVGVAFALSLMLITALLDGLVFRRQEAEFALFVETIKRFPAYFANLSIWLIVILGIMMFISNLSLMKHEGLRPTNMVGTFLGVIFVAGTLILYLGSTFLANIGTGIDNPVLLHLKNFIPMFFYGILDYAECLMFGIMFMGWAAARKKPRYDKDFIIILGCSISKTGALRPLLKGRTNRAIRYAWEQEIETGKPVRFVPSGGQGPDEVMSEASAMELYLLSHAAEPDEVFPEKKSRSTYENFKFSKAIIDGLKPDAKVAFSTTNYHVLRSGLLARQAGLDAEGIASSTKWYFWPNGFAREVVAIFTMTRKIHITAAIVLAVICLVLS